MKPFIIVILVSLICSEAAAQDWVSTGGPGGGFYQIVYKDKKNIFVSAGTLLRSTDAGQSWEKNAPPDAPDGTYWGIAIAANQDIYITGSSMTVVDSTRIWKSSDNGNTWNREWWGNVYFMFTSPDSTIYVLKNDDPVFSLFLWRSKNSGAEWDSIPLPSFRIGFTTVDSNGVLFLANYDDATSKWYYLRSTDRGISWNNVLPNKKVNYSSTACGKKGNIFISVSDSTSHYSAYHSMDDGLHWTLIPDISIEGFFSVSPSGKVFFICSTYHAYSDDNGTTWTKCPNTYPLNYGGNINTDADSGFYVISGGYGTAAFYSNDPCGNWVYTSMPTGTVVDLICYKDRKVFSRVGIPYGNGIPYGSQDAIQPIIFWKSNVIPNSWNFSTTFSGSGYPGKFVLDSSLLYFFNDNSIYRSSDSGITWDSISHSNMIGGSKVNSVVIYPNGIWFATSGGGISISTDNGVTWNSVNSPLLRFVNEGLTRSRDGILYAGGSQNISRSDDTGKTWIEFPIAGGDLSVHSLITDAYGNVFAGFNTYIQAIPMYRSTDQGRTWGEFSNGLTGTIVNSMIELPDGAIAAATDSGVFILPLAECQWQPYSSGLWTKDILSLACSTTGEFYAGSNGCGVFKSTKLFNDIPFIAVLDPGAINYQTVNIGSTSCQDVALKNRGLKPFTISSFTAVDPVPFSLNDVSAKKFPITLAPNDSVIVTICFHPYQPGIYGSQIIWNTDIDSSLCGISRETELHGVAIEPSGVNAEKQGSVFSISPNPIHDKADLNFSLEGESHVKIECFDLLGRSVKIITEGNFQAGKHVLTCDFSNLSEGVYILQCSFSNNRESRSIIIM